MTDYDDGWFKVSRRMLDSSRWFNEDSDTIKLLIFLIAEAQNPLNPIPGTVLIGDTGVASRIGLPVEKVKAAMARLLGPDEESRTPGPDGLGRTLERIPGGVRICNHDLYHPGMIESAIAKKAIRVERARKAASARWAKHGAKHNWEE